MRRLFHQFFLWSWLLTVPLTVFGAYWTYHTIDRFVTFAVRYNPGIFDFSLGDMGTYEYLTLKQRVFSAISRMRDTTPSSFSLIHLFVSESNLSTLETHMPQSGFDYVKGRMLIDGKLAKVQIKYRGDYIYHWGFDKKSIRVRTSKNNLFDGMRSFNLQAPKWDQQLNNFLSLQLATRMGLLAPRTRLVRIFINGKDRGIYVFVEQLGESALRRFEVMPGDLYRGEMVGKDRFHSIGDRIWLFDSTSLWDKMSTNNHYPLSSMAPLEQLLDLIERRESEEAQKQLSQLLDMKAWGRFSAFEMLAHTKHYSKSHNWRLYYDPWRRKLMPIVWDPAGWRWKPKTGERTVAAVINSRLHLALFLNGDFLRARHAALENFFRLGHDDEFLHFVTDTIDRMSQEVKQDPFLRPGDPEHVIRAMRNMEFRITQVFADIQEKWASDANTSPRYYYHDSLLQLGTGSRQTIQRLRIQLLRPPDTQLRASAEYLSNGEMKQVDLSGAVQVENSTVLLNTKFLSRQSVYEDVLLKPVTRLHTSPGYYRIRFEGLDPELEIVSVEVDRGNGWLPAESVDTKEELFSRKVSTFSDQKASWGKTHWEDFGKAEGRTLSGDFVDYVNNHPDLLAAYQIIHPNALDIDEGKELEPADFGQLYAPVEARPLPDPVIWSGTVTFAGYQTLKDDLIIQPGTTVRLAPDATLVLKGRLLAEGTPERPIRFLSQQADQSPWGAIVLMGQGANGSRLTHCEMAGGSGRKGDLFEYSAMFSVHDVKDVSVQDCLFRDNRVVDDMVHTVYADIRFERTRFKNAFADALDLDISEAVIIDSQFDNSGNDAVDLMTSEAVITGTIFKYNDDKGISVGENSQLCAVNNRLIGNMIGVESKDRSTAVLFNHSFVDNKTALHAYKKNWRYGEGGRIFIAKSAIVGGEVVAQAQKRSSIAMFDSYVETKVTGKRVSTDSVDGLSRKNASRANLVPNANEYGTGCDVEFIEAPNLLRQHIQTGRRGDHING